MKIFSREHVCPRWGCANDVSSPKLKIILSCKIMMDRINALILMQDEEILPLFNLTKEELEEYKAGFFNVQDIIDLGDIYIVKFLEETGRKDILTYYLRGPAYTKAKLGLKKILSPGELSEVNNYVVQSAVVETADTDDLSLKYKGISTFKGLVNTPKEKSVIDKLSEVLKNEEI